MHSRWLLILPLRISKAIKKTTGLEFVSDRYRYVASQHVTDSIEAVAKVVYPELFAKGNKFV